MGLKNVTLKRGSACSANDQVEWNATVTGCQVAYPIQAHGFVIRFQCWRGSKQETLLIHSSQLIVVQAQLRRLVSEQFSELRDEWRYQRGHGIRERLRERWESEFRPVTRSR